MTPLIDAHEFTDLLLPPKESVAKKTSASRAVVTVAAMIREKNVEQLRSLVAQNKSLSTPTNFAALLENFDPRIADVLTSAGMDFTKLWGHKGLSVDLPVDFLQWAQTTPLLPTQAHELLFQEAVQGIFSNPIARKPCHHKGLPQYATSMLLSAPEKYTKHIIEILEEGVCLYSPQQLSPQQIEFLNGFSQEAWASLAAADQYYRFWSDLNEVKMLLEMCKTFPLLNSAYKVSFKEVANIQQWCREQLSSPDGEIKNSALGKQYPQLVQEFKSSTYPNDQIGRQWNLPSAHAALMAIKNRDLDLDDVLPDSMHDKLQYVNGSQSFLHMMLELGGAETVLMLKNTPEVQKQIAQTLTFANMEDVVRSSTGVEWKQAIEYCPILAEWTDDAGNHFGHYLAASSLVEKDAHALTVLSDPRFQKENAYGVTPRRIFAAHISDKKLAEYDKRVLKTNLKQSKGAGKPSPSPFKRKM